jgi:phosphatidylglycerol:prolipoprotein diacylglycerol transferase
LSLLFALGVLIGGRAVEVVFYESAYYRVHPWRVFAYWMGGMSTHGILLGAVAGTWLFCRLHGKRFLAITDELTIPGAFLMGLGRIGNFIDGQIVGSVTNVWWAVKFPDAEGFRHPVVLYDGLKNLLLIPLLLWIRKRPSSVQGTTTAHFVFWYGFLRIFVDVFREYPTSMFGIGTGQYLNILMALVGIVLLVWVSRWRPPHTPSKSSEPQAAGATMHSLWAKRVAFACLLLFSLTIPSDWTQDVPARYGKRHPSMRPSLLYPPLTQGGQVH